MNRREAFCVLGIEPTDDKKEIRRAYADLARRYHPEEHPEEWKAIYDAYKSALLGTEERNCHGDFLLTSKEGIGIGPAEKEDMQGEGQKEEPESAELEGMFSQLGQLVAEKEEAEREYVAEQLSHAIATLRKLFQSDMTTLADWEEFFGGLDLGIMMEKGFLDALGDCLEKRKISEGVYRLVDFWLDEIYQIQQVKGEGNIDAVWKLSYYNAKGRLKKSCRAVAGSEERDSLFSCIGIVVVLNMIILPFLAFAFGTEETKENNQPRGTYVLERRNDWAFSYDWEDSSGEAEEGHEGEYGEAEPKDNAYGETGEGDQEHGRGTASDFGEASDFDEASDSDEASDFDEASDSDEASDFDEASDSGEVSEFDAYSRDIQAQWILNYAIENGVGEEEQENMLMLRELVDMELEEYLIWSDEQEADLLDKIEAGIYISEGVHLNRGEEEMPEMEFDCQKMRVSDGDLYYNFEIYGKEQGGSYILYLDPKFLEMEDIKMFYLDEDGWYRDVAKWEDMRMEDMGIAAYAGAYYFSLLGYYAVNVYIPPADEDAVCSVIVMDASSYESNP